MPDAEERASGIDCLRRGLRSLRANPSVAVAAWLQQVLTLGLTVAGFVPVLAALGISWRSLLSLPPLERLLDPEALAAPLADLLMRGPQIVTDLALALGLASVVWLVATFLFCWFQGGIYGLLHDADRQAAEVTAPWSRFRAATWSGFETASRRLFWPCFKLIHLYLLAVLLLVLVWSLLLLAASSLVGPAEGLVVSAVGALLLLLVVAPLSGVALVSFWLAQAELPRPGTTVHAAARRSLAVLRRRPADVLVLFTAYLAGTFVVSGFAALLSALSGPFSTLDVASFATEFTLLVMLTTAFAASTVALMRNATPAGETA